MTSMDGILMGRSMSLLQSLRSDPSFVQPGADHQQAAMKLHATRQQLQDHEGLRTHRARIQRAREHVNAHLIPGLRRPMMQYQAPPLDVADIP